MINIQMVKMNERDHFLSDYTLKAVLVPKLKAIGLVYADILTTPRGFFNSKFLVESLQYLTL